MDHYVTHNPAGVHKLMTQESEFIQERVVAMIPDPNS